MVSDWITTWVLYFMAHAWKYILAGMCLVSFLGEKQIRCECHTPARFKVIIGIIHVFRSCTGNVCESTCRGTCVDEHHTRRWMDLAYGFSWSIYVFDLGMWIYAALFAAFITGLIVGSILAIGVLIILVIFIIVSAVVMVIAGACEGGGGGSDCGPCHCDVQGACDCDGCCTGPNVWIMDPGPSVICLSLVRSLFQAVAIVVAAVMLVRVFGHFAR
jgi:hypothetical protein